MSRIRGGVLIVIIVIVAILLLGGCILAAKSCIGSLLATKDEVEKACSGYITEVDAGDYHAAYARLDPAWSSSLSEADFMASERKVREQYGKTTAKSLAGFNIRNVNGDQTAVVTYDETLEKGKSRVTYALHCTGGAWRFSRISYSTSL